jgi:uncharacterized membrane protein YcaP (DUF421 family)
MQLTLVSILVRVTVMYVIALVLMRLLGKPSIGDLSSMDFVVTTILGDAFDTIIFGEKPILTGMVYFVTIALLHMLVSYLASRSDPVFRLINSPARLMIQNGMPQGDGMQMERMRPEDIAWNLRECGEDQLSNVKAAWLENNGKLSVVRTPASKPVQKQDLIRHK